MLRRISLLGLWLEPLVSILWILFLLWTGVVGVLWTTGIGEVQLDAWVPNLGLRSALVLLCKLADAIWIALAAACAYLCVADTHGIAIARRWALIVFVGAAAIVAFSVQTTWPLGPIRYSLRFGAKLGPVPACAPLLWLCIIFGARALWMRCFRHASHAQIALGVGVCALVTIWNLESLASQVRGLWSWYTPGSNQPSTAPLQNYATWFIGATVLAFFLREPTVVGEKPGHSDKLIAVLVLMNTVFLAAHIAGMLHK
jgi:uncharacterized membrane protein